MGVQRWDGRIDLLWSFIASAPAEMVEQSGQRPPTLAGATIGFTLSSVSDRSGVPAEKIPPPGLKLITRHLRGKNINCDYRKAPKLAPRPQERETM